MPDEERPEEGRGLIPVDPRPESAVALVPDPVDVLHAQARRRLQVLADGFLASLKSQAQPTTAQSYRKRLRCFLGWLNTRPETAAWTATLLADYRTFLASHPSIRSTLTKNNHLVAVRRFSQYLQTLGFTRQDPGLHVKGWTVNREHRRRPLPVHDAKAWLHILETDPRKSELQRLRDLALGYLLIKTGLRTCEAATAQLAWLVPDEPGAPWRLYVHGKGRREDEREYVRCVPAVMEKLQAYFHVRGVQPGEPGPLFASIETRNRTGAILQPGGRSLTTWTIHHVLTEALLLAGVKHPGIVVHSLRHSAPTYALLNKAHPTTVQKMLRHRDYRTTQIYVESVARMIDGAEDQITQL